MLLSLSQSLLFVSQNPGPCKPTKESLKIFPVTGTVLSKNVSWSHGFLGQGCGDKEGGRVSPGGEVLCSSSCFQMNKDTAEKRAVRKGNISNKSLNLKSSLKESGFPRTQVDTEMFPHRLLLSPFCESIFSLFCLSKSAFCLSYVLLSYCCFI